MASRAAALCFMFVIAISGGDKADDNTEYTMDDNMDDKVDGSYLIQHPAAQKLVTQDLSQDAAHSRYEPPAGCSDPVHKCPDVRFTAEDTARLNECKRSLPVKAPKRVHPPQQEGGGPKPLYLFLLTPPYSGSSALLSLIGTSQRVATLCPAKNWQCEGTWVLTARHLMDADKRWEPNRLNWSRALDAYEEVWREDIESRGPQAYVRVDKSPPNVAKVREIAEHFASAKHQVAFIVMTRSPCCRSSLLLDPWRQYSHMQLDGMRTLSKGYRFLQIKYEDLLGSPCDTAKRILDFLPELDSLNPGITGHTTEDKERGTPVLDYALSKSRKGAARTFGGLAISQEAYKLSLRLGYGELPWAPCPRAGQGARSARAAALAQVGAAGLFYDGELPRVDGGFAPDPANESGIGLLREAAHP